MVEPSICRVKQLPNVFGIHMKLKYTPSTVAVAADLLTGTMTEAEIQGMQQFLATRAQTMDFDGYFQALEQDASISRPAF